MACSLTIVMRKPPLAYNVALYRNYFGMPSLCMFYSSIGEKEVRTEGGKNERKKSVIALGPGAETGIVFSNITGIRGPIYMYLGYNGLGQQFTAWCHLRCDNPLNNVYLHSLLFNRVPISPGIAVAPYPQVVIGHARRLSDVTGLGHVTEPGKGRDHTHVQGN